MERHKLVKLYANKLCVKISLNNQYRREIAKKNKYYFLAKKEKKYPNIFKI